MLKQNSKTLLKIVSFHSFIVSLVFQSIVQTATFSVSVISPVIVSRVIILSSVSSAVILSSIPLSSVFASEETSPPPEVPPPPVLIPTSPDINLPDNSNIKIDNQNSIRNPNEIVDIISIEKANNGFSHNKVNRFDALEREKVINNSANSGNSHLAGELAGNQNFEGNANNEASKILFEVSGNKSQLTRNIEVFGRKADL